MKNSLIVTLVCLLFSGLFNPKQGVSADRVYLDIAASETRKISFAVPWLTEGAAGQRQNLGVELADIIAKALVFHGVISVVPASDYGGAPTANFKQFGVDYAVLGQYSVSGKNLTLELRLIDVATGESILGKSFNGTLQQKNSMLFRFCDNVIEALTGKPGIASTQIAFVSYLNKAKEVYLTDILGTFLRQVTRHRNLVVSPRFTRDGKSMTYSSYHNGNQNLYITDLSQSKTTKALSRRKGLNYAPAWSHDGSKLIATLSKDGNPDLYLLDRQGNVIERLTNRQGINVSASWSPDDSRIVFVSDRTGKPQLYIMDLRTRQTQRLTFEGTENAEPAWSPTEDLIAYSSLTGGVYQIFLIRPGQNTPIQLTDDLSHHESPNWSPDGNQIIFSKRGGRAHQIFAIMKNGSFQRQILNFPGDHTYPQWSR